MSDLKIELNRKGVSEVMKSKEMEALMLKHAQNIQSRLREGYEVTTHIGKSRANAMVAAETPAARRDAYKNNSLLKATGGVK